MGHGNEIQYLSAAILIGIGAYGVIRSLEEYKRHGEPVKTLARTLLVSFFLFGIAGGLGVLVTTAVSLKFWMLQAVSITLGYIILASSTLNLLGKLERYWRAPSVRREKSRGRKPPLPPAAMLTSTEDAKVLLKTIFGYFNVPILAIGREHPESWAKKMGVEPAEYIWLTRVEHPQSVSPSALHILNSKITTFLKNNPNGIVYIEGIEYISFYVDFKSIAKFILAVRDAAIIHGGHLILLVTPETLEPQQYAIFKKELETIDVQRIINNLVGVALFGTLAPGSAPKSPERNDDAGTQSPQEES
ncbi:hypothetical protein APY94_11275 [Thermococcus celericrescens]|uniref:DUF835 domain-containing protein n=1 Tax=Thermococcus celericrescens TaxID=227598 RepID=A0A117ISV4_9EURY|nr:DUF835 domain-containing protein [Thermococcus celericrescens]KUH31962.1 hypothetical protein APY94_11275 [Thermococcus celericrescens]